MPRTLQVVSQVQLAEDGPAAWRTQCRLAHLAHFAGGRRRHIERGATRVYGQLVESDPVIDHS